MSKGEDRKSRSAGVLGGGGVCCGLWVFCFCLLVWWVVVWGGGCCVPFISLKVNGAMTRRSEGRFGQIGARRKNHQRAGGPVTRKPSLGGLASLIPCKAQSTKGKITVI